MSAALSQARDAIAAYEDACERGADPHQHALSARSQISQAHSYAIRGEHVPEQKIHNEVEAVADQLEHTRVNAWLDRAESASEAVEAALDDGRYDNACDRYVDAAEATEAAQEALDDIENAPDGAADRLDGVEADLRVVGERFLDGAADRCETALSADDTTVAVDAWETAFDRYTAAADAGWNGYAPVLAGAIEYQLAWVTAGLLDAMSARATALENDGDGRDGDEAGECYEEAETWFERARDIATERPHHDPDTYEDAVDRVEEKRLESAGWEFGG